MILNPDCSTCVHLHAPGWPPGLRCVAYPDGVPEAIAAGREHHVEIRGDEVDGTVWAIRPGAEEAEAWRQREARRWDEVQAADPKIG